MSDFDNSKKKSGIENIPAGVRKIIFISSLFGLMVIIGGSWAWTLRQEIKKEIVSADEKESSDSLNIDDLIKSLRESFEQLKVSEEQSSATGTSAETPSIPQLSQQETVILKDRILERETLNWKNYVNRDYGFSLMYPSTAIVVEPLDHNQPEVIARIRNAKTMTDLATINLAYQNSSVLQSPNVAVILEKSPDRFFVFLDLAFSTTTDIIIKTFRLIEE